jgi:hypothetical protein
VELLQTREVFPVQSVTLWQVYIAELLHVDVLFAVVHVQV